MGLEPIFACKIYHIGQRALELSGFEPLACMVSSEFCYQNEDETVSSSLPHCEGGVQLPKTAPNMTCLVHALDLVVRERMIRVEKLLTVCPL
jgi:hypothetical protein